VAQFVKVHFVSELLQNKNYQSGNFDKALSETFLKMDELLIRPEYKLELKKLAKQSKEEEELQNQKEKSKQNDVLKQLFDVRSNEDSDIAMFTGCTANACIIDEGNKKIYVANAGDSRSVLCKAGIAYPMSVDHKPDLETEKSRIYKADGWVSEGRIKGNLNLSRSLGDLEYKQNKKLSPADQMITAFPEVHVENLTPDCEFIVLACDGVWDCMTNQEICDFINERIKKGIKLSAIIEEIFDTICAPDIYTGMLLFNFRNWCWLR
jgi:protein phosphatase 1G